MSINVIDMVRQYLASRHMFVDDEWLEGCIEHFSSNNDYTEANIKNLVVEQWLLNNLKGICPGSLPASLKNHPKIVLNGRFVVQINSVIDIGTPAYQQYLKLKKVNMDNIEATTNAEDKISSHRMLKLELTDGVQDITAMEYKPMRNLSCDIRPGFKILIKGPVECRRGMLLLTENTIELLGGEAQELFETNSLPAILSAKFGSLGPDIPANQFRSCQISTRNTTPISAESNYVSEVTQQPTSITAPQPTDFIDDDIDIEQLAALEAEFSDNPGKRSLHSDEANPEKKVRIDANTSDDYPDDDDLLLEDMDYMREIEAQIDAQEKELLSTPVNSGSISVSADPFIYIKQIKEMSENEKAGKVFKVKGQIMTLLSKLSVGKDEWSLKCTIVDGTGRLDVDFTSDVLSKLVGITPQEMIAMKKQIGVVTTKSELESKLQAALKNARDKLQVMYCVIEVTILDSPKITDYKPYEAIHVEQLKRRLPAGKL